MKAKGYEKAVNLHAAFIFSNHRKKGFVLKFSKYFSFTEYEYSLQYSDPIPHISIFWKKLVGAGEFRTILTN
jgi:hypothetical protein